MVRVGALIVVRCMTAGAGIRRIVIIAIVAGITIIGDSRMSTRQRIIIVMYVKSCRSPARSRCMAARAIRRYTQRYVVGVRTLIIVNCMTTRALRRSA